MLNNIAKKIFGTQNERELTTVYPIVEQINQFEAQTKALSDAQLAAKTVEFRERLAKGESLDSIHAEAFAVVREAAIRVLGMRHYDVQMIGGTILHRGRIAEMRTGEGKTLVSTLPAYLNALTGKGVHIVTVNDYLARRDAEWMARVHNFLGLSVGVIVHGLNDRQRKEAYRCDITYGTNSEFGFDYLRDNMKYSLDDYVQRELHYAIVDEVDSILIDEARTPLIISGPTEESTDKYYIIDRIIPKLDAKTDYTIEEKSKTAALSEDGVAKVEKFLGVANLYDPEHIELVHHVNQALKAHVIFKRDVDYVVKDGEVMIVDEFTGRLMPGRRWSDGLHQAVEAKEGVNIENENQTLATITYQNFFRMYSKLSGMTGTADTEAAEFKKIYNLDVVVIPTNRPMVRKDQADLIFKSVKSKFLAIAKQIRELHEKGQPVLVGTISIEKSELLSMLLKREGIPHHVLNAKHHEREAEIVAQAGRKGGVTIATNMAGRGTDILLGGNPEFLAKQKTNPEESPEEYTKTFAHFKEQCAREHDDVVNAGGLFILGTERHESRRIDNQLRGRAGRQGDPGESRFFLSFEDDLLRIFAANAIIAPDKMMEEDVPIEHRWTTRAVETAQKKVEAHNFDIRKHLLEYDDVMNQQRKVVYGMRREVLAGQDLKGRVLGMIDEIAEAITQDFFPSKKNNKGNSSASWDLPALNEAATMTLRTPIQVGEADLPKLNTPPDLAALIAAQAEKAYNEKETRLSSETMRELEKMVLLTTIDQLWKDHLLAMDHLREGINLRGYGQKDPLLEYKKEGYSYFQMMYAQISYDVVQKLFAVEVQREEQIQEMAPEPTPMVMSHGEVGSGPADDDVFVSTPINSNEERGPDGEKIGRNDPCPCGSGKKYKKCHGA